MINSFLFYLFIASIKLSVFYLIYRAVYRRLTFHNINRILMLSIIIISFINIEIEESVISDNTLIKNTLATSAVYVENNLNNIKTLAYDVNKNNFNRLYALTVLYFGGFSIFLLKMLRNLQELFKLIKHSRKQKEGRFWILYSDVDATFSFFNYIFVPKNYKGNVNQMLLEHEKSHSKLGHSFDLLFTELLVIVLWFNPIVYYYRKDLRAIHEFQVDNIMLDKNTEYSIEYLQLILNSILFQNKKVDLYNYFNGITIKKRLEMINKKKNSKMKLMVYTVIVPIVLIMSISIAGAKPKSEWLKQVQQILPVPINDLAKLATVADSVDIPSISPIAKESCRHGSGFGKHTHPILKMERFHYGIDLIAKKGTPVKATANGKVYLANYDNKYGYQVAITHGGDYTTRYANLQQFIVKEGQIVKKGEVIAYVGNTGLSTAPHLHYEIIKSGKYLNPEDFM